MIESEKDDCQCGILTKDERTEKLNKNKDEIFEFGVEGAMNN